MGAHGSFEGDVIKRTMGGKKTGRAGNRSANPQLLLPEVRKDADLAAAGRGR